MKILIITGGFFPGKKYGGPPVSVDNFCSLMKGFAECYIVALNHDFGDKERYSNIHEGWNNRGNANVLYVPDKAYNTTTFEKVIHLLNPDYIYLQSLFQSCIINCLKLAKKYHIKVVLAPRGELCVGAFRKKYKKLPYIVLLRLLGLLKDVYFQSTSEEETQAINSYLGASKERIHFLTNIPSIPNRLPLKSVKKSGIGHFVFISRILWKKNLLGSINYLKQVKGNVVFDIYGPKEDESYWLKCKQAIKQLPSNVKVEYKGVLSHEDIHKTFNQYDALLFPTLSENYGHVIAEALVTGCIPIISDQTPWTDINVNGIGWALPLENEDAFVMAIQEVVDMNQEVIQKKRIAISTYIDKKLNIEKLKEEYKAVFKPI